MAGRAWFLERLRLRGPASGATGIVRVRNIDPLQRISSLTDRSW
jgi:hypothetical protein